MQEIEVQRDALGSLETGDYVVPLTDVSHLEEPPYVVRVGNEEFVYARSVPVKGHGATLPPLLDEWVAEGRDVLVGQRGMRYYVYLTPAATPAAAGS